MSALVKYSSDDKKYDPEPSPDFNLRPYGTAAAGALAGGGLG